MLHYISDRTLIFTRKLPSVFPKQGPGSIGISRLTDKDILFTMHAIFERNEGKGIRSGVKKRE